MPSAGAVAGSVLKLMAPHFPAVAPAAKPSPTLLASLTTLNLQVCSGISHQTISHADSRRARKPRRYASNSIESTLP